MQILQKLKKMEKISITPQMLRAIVKELQMCQVFVNIDKLRSHILRHYPVEEDFKILEKELQENLKYAVRIGLLAKHGDDQYCIPTLYEEANATENAISLFQELYKNSNRLCDVSKKRKNDAK